eukprot:403345181
MLNQRKLAEDVGFQAGDVVKIVKAYQDGFAGSPKLFDSLQQLIIKFKYTATSHDVLHIVNSLTRLKQTIRKDLLDLLLQINQQTKFSDEELLMRDFVNSAHNLNMNYCQERDFVTDRSQIQANVLPYFSSRKSYKTFLKEGETYLYCTCGLSKNQPFCDGSHVELPQYKPLKFTHLEEDKIIGLCGCKMNKVEKGPYCDGSHKKLDFDQLEKERTEQIIKEKLKEIKQ